MVDATPPDSATLFLRPTAGGFYRGFPMRPAGGYEYAATVPAAALRGGAARVRDHALPRRFGDHVPRRACAAARGTGTTTAGRPGRSTWSVPRTPLRLFDPGADAARLAFSRIGDAGRRGLFRVGFSDATGQPVFHLELPAYAGRPGARPTTRRRWSIVDRIRARGETIAGADAVHLRLRGLGPRQVLHVTLMEDDGTSWSAAVPVDSTWSERVAAARGLHRRPRRPAAAGIPRRVELLGGSRRGARRQRGPPAARARGAAAAVACGARTASRSRRAATAWRWSRSRWDSAASPRGAPRDGRDRRPRSMARTSGDAVTPRRAADGVSAGRRATAALVSRVGIDRVAEASGARHHEGSLCSATMSERRHAGTLVRRCARRASSRSASPLSVLGGRLRPSSPRSASPRPTAATRSPSRSARAG